MCKPDEWKARASSLFYLEEFSTPGKWRTKVDAWTMRGGERGRKRASSKWTLNEDREWSANGIPCAVCSTMLTARWPVRIRYAREWTRTKRATSCSFLYPLAGLFAVSTTGSLSRGRYANCRHITAKEVSFSAEGSRSSLLWLQENNIITSVRLYCEIVLSLFFRSSIHRSLRALSLQSRGAPRKCPWLMNAELCYRESLEGSR